ncbi:GAF domain-containing protein [Nakamurella leprariae]|uniref:GAF domain-containing protein n=1 Tax=Nakamurella leprariae TaxID=2803911 RepID=A0A938Y5D5_9ACTN|nr:GAF domain-containing protein [Nakamurella leprariae]MBM9466351.1 GAF domain-containing protein [Nakamurella leprariae]
MTNGGLARVLADLSAEVTRIDLAAARLDRVVRVARDVLGVDSVGMLLLDEDEQLRTVATTGDAAEALERVQERLGLGPGVDCSRDRTVVAVDDLAAVPAYAPLWHELGDRGVRAVLAVPVGMGHQHVGNLNSVRTEAYAWTESDVRTAAAFAELIADLLALSSPGPSGSAPVTAGEGVEVLGHLHVVAPDQDAGSNS